MQPGNSITLQECKTNKLQLKTVEQDYVVPVIMTSSQADVSMLSVDATQPHTADGFLRDVSVGSIVSSYTGTINSVRVWTGIAHATMLQRLTNCQVDLELGLIRLDHSVFIVSQHAWLPRYVATVASTCAAFSSLQY
jgi:hypothetical protein